MGLNLPIYSISRALNMLTAIFCMFMTLRHGYALWVIYRKTKYARRYYPKKDKWGFLIFFTMLGGANLWFAVAAPYIGGG